MDSPSRDGDSPRRQSLLDAASDFFTSMREGRASLTVSGDSMGEQQDDHEDGNGGENGENDVQQDDDTSEEVPVDQTSAESDHSDEDVEVRASDLDAEQTAPSEVESDCLSELVNSNEGDEDGQSMNDAVNDSVAEVDSREDENDCTGVENGSFNENTDGEYAPDLFSADEHFSITIGGESPPKPSSTNTNNQSVVRPNLPPIDEMIVSTLGVGTQRLQTLENARKRVGMALKDVLSMLPVTKMSDRCFEAVEKLNQTGELLDAEFVEELRLLGGILRGIPVPRLSPKCYEAIEEMAASGQVLEVSVIMELQSTGALAFCAKPPDEYQEHAASEKQLAELRAAVAFCTLSSLESAHAHELLALWALVHTSVSSEITAEMAEKVSTGEVHYLGQKVKFSAGSLRLGRIQVAAEQDVEAGGDTDLLDELEVKATAQRIFLNGLGGMKSTMALSRQSVDDALQMIREGRNLILQKGHVVLLGSCFATFSLPPLLRLEILRDFFQIAGLFFSGMYGPVLAFLKDQQVPYWIYSGIAWLRDVYNWLAMDISQLLAYLTVDEALLSKVWVALLLSGILLVHWSFLAVVFRLWWTMPRTTDKVRHGHEATTWAIFATRNAWTTKFATIFITICLTAYLPLTQMSFDVLVVTNNPRDESAMNSVRFASQYRHGPLWFLFPLEAILLLFTFTLSLPFLLVWSIKKNQPSGSLENEDATYDLDGESVKFDDKVYTELVSSDPSQLGCPYRSLYAGFERNWSTYKVMQMVAKILMAIIVVSAGKSVQVGGTLISVFYFLVVVLSKYSAPFIDPFDDWMEFFSKLTALSTAVGATVVAYVARQQVVSRMTAHAVNGFMGFVVIIHGINILVMLTVLFLGMNGARGLVKRKLGWLLFSDTSRVVVDARAKNVIPNWNLEKEAKHRVWQSFWRAILLELAASGENDTKMEKPKRKSKKKVGKVSGAARLSSLEEAVVASGLQRVKSHWYGKEHTYTAQLRKLAREALEGVDVYWNYPFGARDGHLDSVTCFGKMYVVPYPFQCVVVYDDAADEAIITDECDENSPLSGHENLAKLLFLNFTPDIMAKRELRQKLRILSEDQTPIELPFTRTEKAFLGPKLQGWKWWIIPIFSAPGYYKFECKYTCGVIRVQTSNDKTGVLTRVNKSGAVKVFRRWLERQLNRRGLASLKRWVINVINSSIVKKMHRGWAKLVRRIVPDPVKTLFTSRGKTTRDMADGFNVTIKYKDGRGEVQMPETGYKYSVRGCRKALMKADHIGLKPSMDESDILRMIFENTREIWPEGLRNLHEKHREYRQRLAMVQDEQTAALSDDFWFFVYNDARLPRDKLEQYLLECEENPALKELAKTHNEALDALYLRQQWVFLHPQITFWYIFWDDVYTHNSDFKCLEKKYFDPLSPTSICYRPKVRSELEEWLRKRKVFKRWSLFHPGLVDLLYQGMEKYASKSTVNGDDKSWKA